MLDLLTHPRVRGLVPKRFRPRVRAIYFQTRSTAGKQRIIAKWLRGQAQWCHRLGSPLYGRLLDAAAADVEAGGPAWDVLEAFEPGPAPCDALGFRLMGSMHRLVLEGRVPALAAYYPSADGDASNGDPWPAFRDAVVEHRDVLRELLQISVQTNDVGRCRALVGGFLHVARETRLPLRMLEVGASAGLNLRWDHYRYEFGDATWGDPGSPVRLVDGFANGRPELDVNAQVAERRGCDLAPLDPGAEEDRLMLTAYTWADQVERLKLLRGALEVARAVPISVERAEATEWLSARLGSPTPGLATVVYHSYVVQYFDPAGRESFVRTIEAAGGRASPTAPLAWLRLEREGKTSELRLTLWPGKVEEMLATTDPYGQEVRWLKR